jgi:hypothetical protein
VTFERWLTQRTWPDVVAGWPVVMMFPVAMAAIMASDDCELTMA